MRHHWNVRHHRRDQLPFSHLYTEAEPELGQQAAEPESSPAAAAAAAPQTDSPNSKRMPLDTLIRLFPQVSRSGRPNVSINQKMTPVRFFSRWNKVCWNRRWNDPAETFSKPSNNWSTRTTIIQRRRRRQAAHPKRSLMRPEVTSASRRNRPPRQWPTPSHRPVGRSRRVTPPATTTATTRRACTTTRLSFPTLLLSVVGRPEAACRPADSATAAQTFEGPSSRPRWSTNRADTFRRPPLQRLLSPTTALRPETCSLRPVSSDRTIPFFPGWVRCYRPAVRNRPERTRRRQLPQRPPTIRSTFRASSRNRPEVYCWMSTIRAASLLDPTGVTSVPLIPTEKGSGAVSGPLAHLRHSPSSPDYSSRRKLVQQQHVSITFSVCLLLFCAYLNRVCHFYFRLCFRSRLNIKNRFLFLFSSSFSPQRFYYWCRAQQWMYYVKLAGRIYHHHPRVRRRDIIHNTAACQPRAGRVKSSCDELSVFFSFLTARPIWKCKETFANANWIYKNVLLRPAQLLDRKQPATIKKVPPPPGHPTFFFLLLLFRLMEMSDSSDEPLEVIPSAAGTW